MSLLSRLFARKVPPVQVQGDRIWPQGKQAGVYVSPDTALTLAAVWGCVRLISESLAHLPWRVHQRSDRGSDVLFDHSVTGLLNRRPNPEMSAFVFRRQLLADVLLNGNGYAEIVRDNFLLTGPGRGLPSELWPLDSRCVWPTRTPSGELVYDVAQTGGGTVRLAARDVLHVPGLGYDGLNGYSVVRYAARSLGLGMAAETYGATFFGNGASIGGVLTTEQPLTEPQRAEVERMLEEKYRGPERAHRTLLLSHGTKYEQTAIPPEDAQFLETRKFQVAEVCRWFRVPPHKIGDLDKATFSNIEHQSIEFVVDTLLPWAKLLEQEADYKLIALPETVQPRLSSRQFTRIALEGLLRGDAKSRAEYYQIMRNIGAYSVNDILALEDRNTIGPEGDKRLAPMNMTTLERIGEEPAAKAPPALPGDPAADPADPEGEDPASEDLPAVAGWPDASPPRYLNRAFENGETR